MEESSPKSPGEVLEGHAKRVLACLPSEDQEIIRAYIHMRESVSWDSGKSSVEGPVWWKAAAQALGVLLLFCGVVSSVAYGCAKGAQGVNETTAAVDRDMCLETSKTTEAALGQTRKALSACEETVEAAEKFSREVIRRCSEMPEGSGVGVIVLP